MTIGPSPSTAASPRSRSPPTRPRAPAASPSASPRPRPLHGRQDGEAPGRSPPSPSSARSSTRRPPSTMRPRSRVPRLGTKTALRPSARRAGLLAHAVAGRGSVVRRRPGIRTWRRGARSGRRRRQLGLTSPRECLGESAAAAPSSWTIRRRVRGPRGFRGSGLGGKEGGEYLGLGLMLNIAGPRERVGRK